MHLHTLPPTQGGFFCFIHCFEMQNLRADDSWVPPQTENIALAQGVVIPAHLDYSDLQLRRQIDGSVQFNWAPIEIICEASNIDARVLKKDAGHAIATLLIRWYAVHRLRGGALDQVQEELMSDALTEDWGDRQHTFPPGHA